MATERIFALFQDVEDAERAIGALEDHGIGRNQIGIALRHAAEADETTAVRGEYARVVEPENLQQRDPVVQYEKLPGALPPAAIASTVRPTSDVDTPINVETVGKEGITTTTGADAAAGAAVGSGVGLVAGLIAAAVALAIPGVGIVLAGGALASAVGLTAGGAVAGAVAGSAAGYMRDMGMPEQAAVHFADRVAEGDYLLTVVVDTSQYDTVKQLLMKYNATGVDMNFATAGEIASPVPPPPPPVVSAVPKIIDTVEQQEQVRVMPPTVIVAAPPHIVTETPDGVPLVPAQVVPSDEQNLI